MSTAKKNLCWSPNRTMGLSKSCIMLIVIAGKERFAFKGVASNLVIYLTSIVKMSNSSAAKTVSGWNGLTSMLPLFLAPLADSDKWDRFSTILLFSFIYVVGLTVLTSTTFSWTSSSTDKISSPSLLFFSLCLISLGVAGYNPSLQALGIDQLDNDEELPRAKDDQVKSNKKTLFFKWWYFGVCSGSLLGITVMSYIQENFGWVLGFAIPTIAMLISTAFFSCASHIYTRKSNENIKVNPFLYIVQAIKAAASKLRNRRIIALPIDKSDVVELELQEKPLCHDRNLDSSRELNDGNPKHEEKLVQNLKIVLRVLPIWTMLLMFAVIFQQPTTFFLKQGMTMKRNIGSKFKIPPATLQSALAVSIILFTPLYDTIFIPIIQFITRREKRISVMERLGIGMFLSIMAMIIAAIVETKRLEVSKQSETATISIFWLLPQYILLGFSDFFTVVALQEFFYNELPIRMRTMAFALYTSVFGVGSFFSALLISVIEVFNRSRNKQNWFADDMREARLDLYYWFLALAGSFNLLLYIVFCKIYKSRSDFDNQENCK
ncbi:protein NRT1/ PTR FAMILY 5.9-like [Melia azedarach]|uniref:Protein NRT1/ PTR FAMILY 5.9-like n=1 Tax=Melia azedarach TaxID=155640 RepID=A0ACC1Z0C3_MELAZ|nr:protein NRT1/ PTR FAMILY 5.9-like [Melia azedarach]